MRKKVLKIQQVDPNDVKKIREEEAQKVFAKQIYLSLMVLNDKFDFEKSEMKKYLSCMLDLYQSIDKDFCSMMAVAATCKEETGIDLLVED